MTSKRNIVTDRRTRPIGEHAYVLRWCARFRRILRIPSVRSRSGEGDRDAVANRGGLGGRRRRQRRMRARRTFERGSRARRRAPGSRAGLAGERGAVATAQPQRMAGAGRVGVRGVPVARARVAAHAGPGSAAACARAGPRRRFDGERDDGPPRDPRRLRSLGRLRMPWLVLCRDASVPAAEWRATPTSATGPTTEQTGRSRSSACRARRGGRPTTRSRTLRSGSAIHGARTTTRPRPRASRRLASTRVTAPA